MPTISVAAFFADQGSVEFDRKMHQSEYQEAKYLEEYREWNRLSLSDKCFTVLNDNKYKIIISAWAGSLYGSWVLVNRDKIMDTAQKLFKQECTHKVSPLYYYGYSFVGYERRGDK